MLAQAAGFAFLSALTPFALVVGAVYLGSANPRRALLIYLAGAVTVTVIMGIVILVAIHSGGLNHPKQRQPRYGLRLGLGVLALGASLFVARRKPKPPKPDKKPSLISRMMAHPSPWATFIVGMLVFAPSVSFIAAIQTIASAKASEAYTALALAIVVIIDVIFVWLPLGLYLAKPEATVRRLKTANAWIAAHSHTLTVTLLAIAGVLLIGNGIYGLVT